MKEEKKFVKHYTNGEITIVWNSDQCTHVAYCFTELPEVFDPSERPWINAKGASTQRIIEQVNRCPTGALTFFYNDAEKNEKPEVNEDKPSVRVEIMENGPAVIKGKAVLVGKNGREKNCDGMLALCRCGKSKNQPQCDGSHFTNKFE
ncbi:MAG: (4Fe-4S)-binding protein [Bacteroidota bacterium]